MGHRAADCPKLTPEQKKERAAKGAGKNARGVNAVGQESREIAPEEEDEWSFTAGLGCLTLDSPPPRQLPRA
eukprot:8419156-Lingulodinium_polyedra.AAC.1